MRMPGALTFLTSGLLVVGALALMAAVPDCSGSPCPPHVATHLSGSCLLPGYASSAGCCSISPPAETATSTALAGAAQPIKDLALRAGKAPRVAMPGVGVHARASAPVTTFEGSPPLFLLHASLLS